MEQGGTTLPAPELARHVVQFLRHLRLNDFAVGPADAQLAILVLTRCDIGSALAVKRRLKILLARSREQWQSFDALFEAFWFARGRKRSTLAPRTHANPDAPNRPGIWREHFDHTDTVAGAGTVPQIEEGGGAHVAGRASGRLIASAVTLDTRTDLRRVVDADQIAAAERLALRLARSISYRLSRRFKVASRGERLDFRRTLRANLSRGGEPITLINKTTPIRPVSFVALLDVSGSMHHYSRFYLQFIKGLVGQWLHVDAYVMHTRLVRVTEALRERDAIKAMTRLALMADGFGGGTKLGDSLHQFNRRYAKAVTNSRTVVVVFSDGYDTGSVDRLTAEIAQLKRRAPRLVWLNPLLGWRRYEPVNRAMVAAMPYIDCFAAANTLQSLSAIEPELKRL